MSERSEKRVRRIHSDEYRRNAVSLVDDQDYTEEQAARELGLNESLLRTWRKKYGKAASSESGISESDQEELDRLRKEVTRLRMERDILRKATAFFANEKN